MKHNSFNMEQLEQFNEARVKLIGRFKSYKRFYNAIVSPDIKEYTGTNGYTGAFDVKFKVHPFHSVNICLGKLLCVEGYI